ncbi:proline dehydrogenase 1, mitochondrial-like [Canna indica]|uniref:Proline dehydrogenase n=1 Tax=Canna indica TaxID=4628 RepID=A0AAQ3K307_9LILI|nr:proline dehydrogenase 1, mitochondrial-like [Canna indica]
MTIATKIPAAIPRTFLARSLATASSVTEKFQSASAAEAPSPALDLSDTQRLFASVPTSALLRSLAVLSAMAAGPLVDLSTGLLRATAASEGRLLRAAVFGAARATVNRHFCAGEGVEDASHAVRAMWHETGLRSILDYGMEDAEDGAACDHNLAGFQRVVEMASSLPPASTSVCVKITALCPISLLERVSDLLRWKQKDPSFHLPWRTHSFPVLCDSSPLYITPSLPAPLTEAEELELQVALQRLSTICKQCQESNIALIIDAEYSSVQPAIDYFTYSASQEFNHVEQPIVYGTLQTYLRDSRERMVNAFQAAENEGVSLGLKLVRGAYLTRESKLASSLGVSSPIHGSIEETHRCFNDCAAFMLQKVGRGHGAVMLATHNVESVKMTVTKAEELGIRKDDQKLQFAQLMGMADGLSLGLRNAGFQVSKYVPFGPVEEVIPYLLRRAEENRGLLSTSKLDRQLMRFTTFSNFHLLIKSNVLLILSCSKHLTSKLPCLISTGRSS